MKNAKSRKLSVAAAFAVPLMLVPSLFSSFSNSDGLYAEFSDTADLNGTVVNFPKPGDANSGNVPTGAPQVSASRVGANCDITWTNPGASYTNTKVSRVGSSSYVWNGAVTGDMGNSLLGRTEDVVPGPWSIAYKIQHALNGWTTSVGNATCPAWTISDNFNRSGSLAGSTTSGGNAVWVGSGANTNGNVATGYGVNVINYGSANANSSVATNGDDSSALVTRANSSLTSYVRLKPSIQHNVAYTASWVETKYYSERYQSKPAVPGYTWKQCGGRSPKPGWTNTTYFYANPIVYPNLDGSPQLYPNYCRNSATDSDYINGYGEYTRRTKPNFTATNQQACPVEAGEVNGWSPTNQTCGQWGRDKYVYTNYDRTVPDTPAEYSWRKLSKTFYPSATRYKTVWSVKLENVVNGSVASSVTVASGEVYTQQDAPSTCVNDLPDPGGDWIREECVTSGGTQRYSTSIPASLSMTAQGNTVTGTAGSSSNSLSNSNTDHTLYGRHGVIPGNGVDNYSLSGAVR